MLLIVPVSQRDWATIPNATGGGSLCLALVNQEEACGKQGSQEQEGTTHPKEPTMLSEQTHHEGPFFEGSPEPEPEETPNLNAPLRSQ